MPVNFTTKYSSAVAELFSHESFVKPHTTGNLSFEGAKTVRVYQLEPAEIGDYRRSGSNRYGTPTDVEDSVLEYTMTQDKAWTKVVDKGDESDQAIGNKAGKFVQVQTRLKVTPMADKYALKRFLTLGKTVTVTAAPTKSTVVEMFAELQLQFDNALVPDSQRYVYVPSTTFKALAISDEFVKIETLGEKSVAKGEVGMIFGFRVIKLPDGYLPANCYALGVYAPAVAMPYKLADLKINKDAPGYSGALIEARDYYDAFVLGNMADGVVGLVLAGKKCPAPTITATTKTAVKIESTGADKIMYTLDGSDPRFSMTAKQYSTTFDGTGKTVRAVAFDTTGALFTSDIASETVAS